MAAPALGRPVQLGRKYPDDAAAAASAAAAAAAVAAREESEHIDQEVSTRFSLDHLIFLLLNRKTSMYP